jgi:hypothetical protein
MDKTRLIIAMRNQGLDISTMAAILRDAQEPGETKLTMEEIAILLNPPPTGPAPVPTPVAPEAESRDSHS